MGYDQREATNLDANCQCEIQLLGTEPKISPLAEYHQLQGLGTLRLENNAKRNDGQWTIEYHTCRTTRYVLQPPPATRHTPHATKQETQYI